jgi:5-methylcytosine-specific restriction protein B
MMVTAAKATNLEVGSLVGAFAADLDSAGLQFSRSLVDRFVASLLTKRFVILTGLSGSGKTKLAQAVSIAGMANCGRGSTK